MKGAFISTHKCTKHVFFSVEAEKKCPPFPPDAFWFLQNTEISGKIGKNIIRKVFDIHDTCTFYLPRKHLPFPHGGISFPRHGRKTRTFRPIPHCIRRNESRGNRQRSLSTGKTQVGICRHFLHHAPRKAGNEGGLCRL